MRREEAFEAGRRECLGGNGRDVAELSVDDKLNRLVDVVARLFERVVEDLFRELRVGEDGEKVVERRHGVRSDPAEARRAFQLVGEVDRGHLTRSGTGESDEGGSWSSSRALRDELDAGLEGGTVRVVQRTTLVGGVLRLGRRETGRRVPLLPSVGEEARILLLIRPLRLLALARVLLMLLEVLSTVPVVDGDPGRVERARCSSAECRNRLRRVNVVDASRVGVRIVLLRICFSSAIRPRHTRDLRFARRELLLNGGVERTREVTGGGCGGGRDRVLRRVERRVVHRPVLLSLMS